MKRVYDAGLEKFRSALELARKRGDTSVLSVFALDELGAEVVIGYRAKIACIRLPHENGGDDG